MSQPFNLPPLPGTQATVGEATLVPAAIKWTERFQPGDLVGRYIVRGVLGVGGMGVVLSAYDPALDRRVAVKLLQIRHGQQAFDSNATVDEYRQLLLQEAHGMAKLNHPHVVPVYDVGWADGALFLAMELLVGDTLAGWLRQKKRAWQDVVRVMAQAASGLAAIHQQGLIHCDIKPGNLLVDRHGVLYITDFGLAKRYEAALRSPFHAANPERRTATDAVSKASKWHAGTLPYMAPEQHRGDRLDPRCDQFAFFVTLYEAIFGHRPFAGDDHASMLATIERSNNHVGTAAHRAGERDARSHRVPKWLTQIMDRGLAVEPGDRFADMTEVQSVLQSGLQDTSRGKVLVFSVMSVVATAAVAVNLRQDDPCDAIALQPQAMWNEQVEQALQERFLTATGVNVQSAWEPLRAHLQQSAVNWQHYAQAHCRAPTVAYTDVRGRCLNAALAGIGAATRVLLGAPEHVLADPAGVLSAIPDPKACLANASAVASATPWPTSEADQREVARLREQITSLEMHGRAGQLELMQPLYEKLRADALRVGYLPAQAELEFQMGMAQMWFFEIKRGRRHMQDALLLAQAGRFHEIAAWALTSQIYDPFPDPHGDGRELRETMAYSRAAVARVGDPPLLMAEWVNNVGVHDIASGRSFQAEEKFRQSQALAGHLHGRSYLGPEDRLNSIAITVQANGEVANGYAMLQQALSKIPRLGKTWPARAGILLYNLGRSASLLGNYRDAQAWYFEVLRSAPTVQGKLSGTADAACTNLKMLYANMGRSDQALALDMHCQARPIAVLLEPRVQAAMTAMGQILALSSQGYIAAAQTRLQAMEREIASLAPGSEQGENFVLMERFICSYNARLYEQALTFSEPYLRAVQDGPVLALDVLMAEFHVARLRLLNGQTRSKAALAPREQERDFATMERALHQFRREAGGPSHPSITLLAVPYLEALAATDRLREHRALLDELLREREYWVSEIPRQQVQIDLEALHQSASEGEWTQAQSHFTHFVTLQDKDLDDPNAIAPRLDRVWRLALSAGLDPALPWLVDLQREAKVWQLLAQERSHLPFSSHVLQQIINRARRDATFDDVPTLRFTSK